MTKSAPCHPKRSAQPSTSCHPERSAQREVEGSRAATAGRLSVDTARDPSTTAPGGAFAQDDGACAHDGAFAQDDKGCAPDGAFARDDKCAPDGAFARDDGRGGLRLFDLHCHLDFALDPRLLADGLAACGVGGLSVTVEPEGYERAARLLAPCGNVRVGAGLHPWWVEDGPAGKAAVECAVANAAAAGFVGEVGLDFGPKHVASREAQTAAFDRIAAACAAAGGKVLSIHAVRAASVVLDILERRGVLGGNVCILHWFSGRSDELQRAAMLGCYFSVGPHMLASKRGRAYAQAIPAGRLLLETDEPPAGGAPVPAEEFARLLHGALADIARLRREDPAVLAERIAETSTRLLGLEPPSQA